VNQKEESVSQSESKPRLKQTYEGVSAGDSVIYGTANDSRVTTKADEITTAAVNASINAEIERINQSLLNINILMNRKESKEVVLVPEVANNVNKSLNLWNSMMINLNSNSDNQSVLRKSLQDSY